MIRHFLGALAIVIAIGSPALVRVAGRPVLPSVVGIAEASGEGAQAPAVPAAASTAPRTAWGHPDLQGIWSNATITPMERPSQLAGKEVLTEDEAAELNEEARTGFDRRYGVGTNVDLDRAYNAFWWDRGRTLPNRRTSLIVDPPDGRIPFTPEAQAREAARAAYSRAHPADSWEDRSLSERCVTRGAPKLPGGYNNYFLIVQTPEYVAILQEMIHEVRIIPLDGRPHVGQGIRQWMGDSRGRWEGNTLVVDTTNFNAKIFGNSYNCCRGAGANLHVVERFTRVGADTIDYQYTVDDPTTYTRSWTVAVPMTKSQGPIFEYACHEGNYGMANLLSGARAEEKAAEESARKK